MTYIFSYTYILIYLYTYILIYLYTYILIYSMHATGICIYEGNRGIKSKRWQRQDYHRNASGSWLTVKRP
ncbi:hypothetical protein CXF69_13760 [Psychrobacter sp. Choline-02u-9]|nr:hypothetical protein CXF69_13760 [Psychrobacter sp. Choline-02u-9]